MLGSWKARCAPFNVNYRYVAEELCLPARRRPGRGSGRARVLRPDPGRGPPRPWQRPAVMLQVADGSGHPVGSGLLPGALDYEEALAAADPVAARPTWSGRGPATTSTSATRAAPRACPRVRCGARTTSWSPRSGCGGVTAPSTGRRTEIVADARGTRAGAARPAAHARGRPLERPVVLGRRRHGDHPGPSRALRRRRRPRRRGAPRARPRCWSWATRWPGRWSTHCAERAAYRVSLRHVLSGGAVLSPATKAELLELLEGVTIVDVLGSTESGAKGWRPPPPADDPGAASAPPPPRQSCPRTSASGSSPATTAWAGWRRGAGCRSATWATRTRPPPRSPRSAAQRYAVAGDRARWRARRDASSCTAGTRCASTPAGRRCSPRRSRRRSSPTPPCCDAVVCGRPSERWGQEVVAVVQLRAGRDPADDELARGRRRAHRPLQAAEGHHPAPRVVRSPSGKADYRWARAVATGQDA